MKNIIKFSLLFVLSFAISCSKSDSRQKVEYHKNGNVKGIGKVFKEKKIGVWVYYDEDAIEVDSISYKHGMKEGETRAYSIRASELVRKGTYVHDQKQGVWKTYHAGGAVHSSQRFEKGVPVGELRYAYADGAPKMIISIQNGNLHGGHKEYYPSGKVAVSGYYHNGIEDGEWKEYNEKGLLQEVYNYQGGLWHGNYEKYHPNGNIMEKGRFEQDNRKGTWEYFDTNGIVISTQKFK